MAGSPVSVLLGVVPLTTVTSFTLNEGYKVAPIAGSSLISQLIAPTTKTINIEAMLIGGERALRPALEALALTNRFLAAAASPLMALSGIPVVARLGVHLDMQITSLVFVQDNANRDAFKVTIALQHVPRTAIAEGIGAGLDVVMGVAGGFIP
jgi:hypothetical protein